MTSGAIGSDLQLNGATLDLAVVTKLDGTKDFNLIRGVPEVVQAVQTRIRTPRGERLLHPEFGLPSLIGVVSDDFIAAAVRSTISQEPRVTAVGDATVVRDSPNRSAQVRVPVFLGPALQATVAESIRV